MIKKQIKKQKKTKRKMTTPKQVLMHPSFVIPSKSGDDWSAQRVVATLLALKPHFPQ